MPLIVEDGTGRADAESYISVANATAYHAARGNAAWAALASDTIREQLLRKATEYMVQKYRLRWASYRTTSVQALDWPRAWVPLPDAPSGYGAWAAYIPNNVVPVEVQRACAEYALIASAGDIESPLGRETLSEKVGEIEVSYNPNSPQYTRYRTIDMLLGAFLKGNANAMRLVRA